MVTRPLRVAPLVVSALFAFYVLFTPSSDVPSGVAHLGTIIHVTLFAMLAVTSRFAGIGTLVTAVWLAAFGGLSELAQGALPIGRTTSLQDWFADLVGVAAGLVVFSLASSVTKRARRASTPAAPRPRPSAK